MTIIIFTYPSNAAILYVDKDDPGCSNVGSGSSSKPFCSINKATLTAKAGDTIRVREATTAYDESIKFTNSGTSDNNRIILEPDINHKPILTKTGTVGQWKPGMIDFDRKSYITIRNFYFKDVRATNVIRAANTEYRNGPEAATGLTIEGNTFDGGGPLSLDHKNGSYDAIWLMGNKDAVIRNNEIVNWRGSGIKLLRNNTGILIEGNRIHDLKCSRYPEGQYRIAGINTGYGDSVDSSPRNILIQRNEIYNLGPCQEGPVNNGPRYVGIHFDGGYKNNIIQYNKIYNINPQKVGGAIGIGIHLEDASDNNIVRYNIIYNMPEYGLRNGYRNTRSPNNNQYLNNTIFETGVGISVQNGSGSVIRNNLIVSGNPIALSPEAINKGQTGNGIDYNLYYNYSGNVKLIWNGKGYSFSEWKEVCKCDQKSLGNKDPRFVISGQTETFKFDLINESEAKCAGENGVTIGAYPECKIPIPKNLRKKS
jgi:Right handed beta helix region